MSITSYKCLLEKWIKRFLHISAYSSCTSWTGPSQGQHRKPFMLTFTPMTNLESAGTGRTHNLHTVARHTTSASRNYVIMRCRSGVYLIITQGWWGQVKTRQAKPELTTSHTSRQMLCYHHHPTPSSNYISLQPSSLHLRQCLGVDFQEGNNLIVCSENSFHNDFQSLLITS